MAAQSTPSVRSEFASDDLSAFDSGVQMGAGFDFDQLIQTLGEPLTLSRRGTFLVGFMHGAHEKGGWDKHQQESLDADYDNAFKDGQEEGYKNGWNEKESAVQPELDSLQDMIIELEDDRDRSREYEEELKQEVFDLRDEANLLKLNGAEE